MGFPTVLGWSMVIVQTGMALGQWLRALHSDLHKASRRQRETETEDILPATHPKATPANLSKQLINIGLSIQTCEHAGVILIQTTTLCGVICTLQPCSDLSSVPLALPGTTFQPTDLEFSSPPLLCAMLC